MDQRIEEAISEIRGIVQTIPFKHEEEDVLSAISLEAVSVVKFIGKMSEFVKNGEKTNSEVIERLEQLYTASARAERKECRIISYLAWVGLDTKLKAVVGDLARLLNMSLEELAESTEEPLAESFQKVL